jgi:drug/metabolite transporter (DMT)-like permease
VAAIALLACVPATRRGWTWRGWLVGVAYAATLVSFVLANKLGPAANAIFLQSTAPLYLLPLAPLVLHERITAKDLVVFTFVAAGAAILMTSGDAALGFRSSDAVGLLSGLFWALTLLGLRWLGKSGGAGGTAEASVTAGNFIAFGACLPMAISAPQIGIQDAAILLYLGVFQIGLAYALLVRSVRRLPAIQVATLLLAEPVFNPVWAWILQGERPGLRVLAGGAAILTGAFLGSIPGAEGVPEPSPQQW